jgi:hypothetical protein
MIDQLAKNRLYGELRALQDEAAEEIRLGNVPSKDINGVMDMIHKQHNECLKIIKEYPDADVQEVILAFRGLVRNSIKTLTFNGTSYDRHDRKQSKQNPHG